MTAPAIAQAYRTSPQTIARISARFGLSLDDWRHPEKIADVLHAHGFSHPLADHLADPHVQSWIYHALAQPAPAP